MEKKDLILISRPRKDFLVKKLQEDIKEYVEIFPGYREITFIEKIMRKLHLKFFKYFQYIWYDEWFKKDYNNLIIFDSNASITFLENVLKKFPSNRIIFWYWNFVKDKKLLKYIKSKNIEIWSFDINDCKKYDLKYNTQFYFEINLKNNKKTIRDIYFIGIDKNRIKKIEKFIYLLQKYKVTFYFQVLKKKLKKYTKFQKNFLINKPISYEKIIENIMKSKAILEINPEKQSGLTLRVMESLFFQKKLITNNRDIKKYDFYNKNNIFLFNEKIEEIDFKKLKKFLKEPYQNISTEIKEKYTIKNWIKRFEKIK